MAAAPAALLAFAAWRAGNGPLADKAVLRALSADPQFPLAVVTDNVWHTPDGGVRRR
ncbi:DUF4192 family protein [Couchioplanes azureus]|uniref:DUF4192 family protein n=1 Tax=Couchioplanes caeruleus TaxID=56438 RepID=UPI003570FC6D